LQGFEELDHLRRADRATIESEVETQKETPAITESCFQLKLY
jgi:hypothetical protein